MRQYAAKITKKQILESLQSSTKKYVLYIYASSTKWQTVLAKRAAINTSGVKWMGEGRIRCLDQLSLVAFKDELWALEYTRDHPSLGIRIPGTGPDSYTNAFVAPR